MNYIVKSFDGSLLLGKDLEKDMWVIVKVNLGRIGADLHILNEIKHVKEAYERFCT